MRLEGQVRSLKSCSNGVKGTYFWEGLEIMMHLHNRKLLLFSVVTCDINYHFDAGNDGYQNVARTDMAAELPRDSRPGNRSLGVVVRDAKTLPGPERARRKKP
mgnify:CR=1 FL=1